MIHINVVKDKSDFRVFLDKLSHPGLAMLLQIETHTYTYSLIYQYRSAGVHRYIYIYISIDQVHAAGALGAFVTACDGSKCTPLGPWEPL